MKRSLISIFVVLLLILSCYALAEEPYDTRGATKGKIKGSVGIGAGADGNGYLIILPVNTAWLDTGIDIDAGDVVSVSAAGSTNNPPCDGKTGCPPYRNPDDVIVNGHLGKGLTALVGRIGEEGSVFSVGASYNAVASGSGRLFIGYNDCRDCWGDNTGEFEVTVQVTKK